MIYLDNNSTSQINKSVIIKLLDHILNFPGNYNSFHQYGKKIREITNRSIKKISSIICCAQDEIIFTSGATESNNIAIQGIIKHQIKMNKDKNEIICSKIEHDSVLKVLQHYQKIGAIKIKWISPNSDGIIEPEEIEKEITSNTFLVVCMHVQHEIGVINNIKKIGEICQQHGIIFHVDASQSFCKIFIDVHSFGVSTMSFSGHKIGCFKGIGALFISRKQKIRLEPIVFGGGQQRYRSGTIPSELIYIFAEIAFKKWKNIHKESSKLRELQLWMHKEITEKIDLSVLNGPIDSRRIYNNLNYSFYGVEGESILMRLYDVGISTGSACNTTNLEPSKTISSFNGIESAHSSIRISIGPESKKSCIKIFIQRLAHAIIELRRLSPVFHVD